MTKDNRKAVFTALATLKLKDGRKKLEMYSPQHFQQQVNNLVLGKKYGISVEEYKASRSQQQLAFYWTLLGYLSQYSGHQPEELHDAIMRQKFGTKQIVVGDIKQTVRKSIANSARFPMNDMIDLIEEVLRLCHRLGVVVPSKEELGYV